MCIRVVQIFYCPQTDKLMEATKFSDYLGLNHYKKARKVKNFNHLALAYQPQSFSAYHTISPFSEFRPSTKKVCSSDVIHCQISIFEIKMMVKINVIVMSFLNPICHFRDIS